jgi:hypothetical protein
MRLGNAGDFGGRLGIDPRSGRDDFSRYSPGLFARLAAGGRQLRWLAG